MLDLWIIEELRKREEIRRSGNDARYLELPLHDDCPEPSKPLEVDEPKRGVVVIDI